MASSYGPVATVADRVERDLDDAIRMRGIDHALAQLPPGVTEVRRGWSLVDDEDRVRLVQRPYGADREVLGITGADPDDQHVSSLGPDPCPTYYPTCVRKTSVYLPDQLKSQLSALASRTRRSEADLVRAAIELRRGRGCPGGDGAVRSSRSRPARRRRRRAGRSGSDHRAGAARPESRDTRRRAVHRRRRDGPGRGHRPRGRAGRGRRAPRLRDDSGARGAQRLDP